jgi:CRP-like cAMP-binding protein
MTNSVLQPFTNLQPMKELINYLLQFGHLNQQQIDLVKSKGVFKEIKKDEYFQEARKIPREVAFLTEGIIRICYYNNKGDEITKYFIDENNLIVDINSYNQNVPSSGYIQAITDCKFIVFSKEAMKELSMTILIWDDIINKIINKALIEKVNKISAMMAEDATERYLYKISHTCQQDPFVIFSFLFRHHTIFFEPNKKKHTLKRFLPFGK